MNVTICPGVKQTREEFEKGLLDGTFNYYSAEHERIIVEANADHLTKCILKVTGKKELDADLAILAKIYCFGTVQILCQWLLDELQYDDDDRLFELII